MSFHDNVMATCCDCGERFYRAESETWKIRCVPCFVKRKNKQATAGAENPVALVYWQNKASLLESELEQVNRQLVQQAVNIRLLNNQLAAKPTGQGWLVNEFQEQLRRLMQLVHPDKHGNSESATLATQWLLNVRARL